MNVIIFLFFLFGWWTNVRGNRIVNSNRYPFDPLFLNPLFQWLAGESIDLAGEIVHFAFSHGPINGHPDLVGILGAHFVVT
jgi:hypothetical protein